MYETAARRGIIPPRNTPEFMTLVAIAVGLGVAVIARSLRRRGIRR